MASAGQGLWYIGLLFQAVATFCASAGKILIRLSELKNEAEPNKAKWIFRLGLVVNTLGAPLFETLAYTQAAQSLIAPLNGLDTVWNTILAPPLLGEKLTRRYIIGSVIVCIGTAGAGATGNHNDVKWTVEYATKIFISIRVLVYYIAFLALFLFSRFYLMKWPKGHVVRGVALSFTAGALAGNMVCTKAALGLIKHSIFTPDPTVWANWLVYVMMIGGVFFAVNNVFYMTQGLVEFEALFMITIYVGGQIISGAVSGSIVLLDNAELQAWRICIYTLSIIVIVLGMYIVATTLKITVQPNPGSEDCCQAEVEDGKGTCNGKALEGNKKEGTPHQSSPRQDPLVVHVRPSPRQVDLSGAEENAAQEKQEGQVPQVSKETEEKQKGEVDVNVKESPSVKQEALEQNPLLNCLKDMPVVDRNSMDLEANISNGSSQEKCDIKNIKATADDERKGSPQAETATAVVARHVPEHRAADGAASIEQWHPTAQGPRPNAANLKQEKTLE